MTLFGCSNPLNIASTDYVDCVVTTVSGALQEQIGSGSILHTDFTEIAVSGTTSRTNVFSYTIPANLLTSNRALRITTMYQVRQGIDGNTYGAAFRGSLNSTDVIFIEPAVENMTGAGKVVSTIYPKTSMSQKILSEGVVATWPDDRPGDDSRSSYVVDNRSTSVDMTQAVEFELDLQLEVANSTYFFVKDGAIVELI